MTSLIDRRLNAKGKSTVNRQRFMRRYKNQIKASVSNAVTKRSVTDVDSGESVAIPTKDIREPIFSSRLRAVIESVFFLVMISLLKVIKSSALFLKRVTERGKAKLLSMEKVKMILHFSCPKRNI